MSEAPVKLLEKLMHGERLQPDEQVLYCYCSASCVLTSWSVSNFQQDYTCVSSCPSCLVMLCSFQKTMPFTPSHVNILAGMAGNGNSSGVALLLPSTHDWLQWA